MISLKRNPFIFSFLVMPLWGTLLGIMAAGLLYYLFGLLGHGRGVRTMMALGIVLMGLAAGISRGITDFNAYSKAKRYKASPLGEVMMAKAQGGNICPDDLSPDRVLIRAVQNIRGIFRYDVSYTIITWSLIIFLSGGSALTACALLHAGFPKSPVLFEQLAAALAVVTGFVFSAIAYLRSGRGRSFEFNGQSVLERDRSGGVLKSFPLSEITEVNVRGRVLNIRTSRTEVGVFLSKELIAEMERIRKDLMKQIHGDEIGPFL